MKNTGLRILSVLMALAMLLTTVPTAVMAMAAEGVAEPSADLIEDLSGFDEKKSEEEYTIAEEPITSVDIGIVPDKTGSVVLPQPLKQEEQQVSASDNSTDIFEYVEYVDDPDEISLLYYHGNASNVSIPETIDGKTVVGLGSRLFKDCKALKQVTLPNSIKYIDDCTFENSGLTSVIIPENVKQIGASPFKDCINLASVTYNAVQCTEMGAIDWYINAPAFLGCSALKTVTIGENVQHIPAYAFYGCENVSDITIPGSVISIGRDAFTNTLYYNDEANWTDGALYMGKRLIAVEEDISGTFVIAEDTSLFADYIFCKSAITNVTIPESIANISQGAFEDCNNLQSVTIPDSVTAISAYAFANCTALTNIEIPDSVTSIGKGAFDGCTGLTSITISESVMTIDEWTFNRCSSLTSVTIPSRVTRVGAYAFEDCTSLDSITIPNSVTTINQSAFKNCTGIVNATIPGSVVTIGTNAFSGCTSLQKSCYLGDSEQWKKVTVDYGNQKLIDTLLYYDYPVQNLVFHIFPDGSLELSWEKHLNSIWSYYSIKKDDVWIANTEDCAFVDHDFKNKSTIYTINGVSENGEKNEDRTINVWIPGKLVNVIAVGDYYDIKLSWNKSSEVRSEKYYIYRSVDSKENFELLGTVNGRENLTYTDQNVEDEKQYFYYVITENDIGLTSVPSEIAAASLRPDTEPPQVTKFTPASGKRITKTQTVTISAVDNLYVNAVELYYTTDGKEWTLIGEDSSAPFNFAFNTAKLPDGEITLKAVAFDAAGNASNESSGLSTCKYSIDNTGPDKVRWVQAKQTESTLITLEWSDVKADDAACFVLEEKWDDGWRTISSSITTLGYNLEDLEPDHDYTYRVAAMDDLGNIGTYSEPITVRTATDTMPPVVTSLAPSPGRYNNSIQFRATAEDNCGIASISIQVSTDAKAWKAVHTADYKTYFKTASCVYTLSLTNYKDGSIFIRTVALDFAGNKSDETDDAPLIEYIVDKTAPQMPRDFIASGTDTYIYLSWLQGKEDDLDTYSIYRSTDPDGNYEMLASGLNTIDYYDVYDPNDPYSVQPNVQYYYKLRVQDSVGNISDFSPPVAAKLAADIDKPEVISINPEPGSVVGPTYKTIETLVSDNCCLKSVRIEYCIGEEVEDAAWNVLKRIDNAGAYYITARADLPIRNLPDRTKIHVRVFAEDLSGNKLEYSTVYTYHVDAEAPTITALKAELVEDNVILSWGDSENADDVSGYKIYLVEKGGFSYLGSRQFSNYHQYTFPDAVYHRGTGMYTYMIEAYDRVGNFNRFFTDTIRYKKEVKNTNPQPEIVIVKPKSDPVEPQNSAPVVVLQGCAVMEVGVEEYFDAGFSTDDGSIVSFHWDFGDGTTSEEVKPIKKYNKPGTYTVTLTLTDNKGATASKTLKVQVNERVAIGTVKVQVLDEDGKLVAGAPVYFDLGSENVKKIATDDSGSASLVLEKGDHQIGVYKSGYLPVQKTVTVLPNATRTVTMTIIQQELVTGKFEVTRMTFSEIKDAHINISDPANRQVYEVKVQIQYGGTTVPVKYIRNETEILQCTIGDSGGTYWERADDKPVQRRIADVVYIPNTPSTPSTPSSSSDTKPQETIAILDIPVQASYVKEFFDVRLHIINNATSDFKLVNNTVELHVPDGMTLMTGLTGDWSDTAEVKIDSIVGQETKTLAWVLRGDNAGDYDLTADYNGTLMPFGEPYHTQFITDEPVKVYGLTSMKLIMEVDSTIRFNALYFNIGMLNDSGVDLNNPRLDFDGIVQNITASAKRKSTGMDTPDEDFSVRSELLNVYLQTKDGKISYVPFEWDAKLNTITTDIDVLSPHDTIFYSFAAYNAIDYNDIAHFKDATYEVTEGIVGKDQVIIRDKEFESFSMANDQEKIDRIIDQLIQGKQDPNLSYIMDDSNYLYISNSTIGSYLAEGGYNLLKFATIDYNAYSKETQKEIAKQILYDLITEESSYANLDDMVDTVYIDVIKDILGILKDETSLDSSPYSTKDNYAISNAISNLLSNEKNIRELADELETFGTEKLWTRMVGFLGVGIASGAGMEILRLHFADLCAWDSLLSERFKTVSQTAKYTGYAVDFVLKNPIEALNSTEKAQYLHDVMYAYAANEYANLILDTIIVNCSSKNKEEIKNILRTCGYVVSPAAMELLTVFNTDFLDIVTAAAGEMQRDMDRNFSYALEYCVKLLKETAESAGKIAVKNILKSLLGTSNVWYTLFCIAVNAVDKKLGAEEYFKKEDTFQIATCLTIALTSRFWQCISAYKEDAVSQRVAILYGNSVKNENDVREETMRQNGKNAWYLLKAICHLRLIGEESFKAFYDNDNTTLFHGDTQYDEKILKTCNQKFGKQFENIEQLYDYVYGAILKARDTLFNTESQTAVVKPDAPTVTFNYDTLQTNETFDDSYEYCLSDGEWVRCSGAAIPVKPKTHTTILRVRKASGNGTVAGEITTITIDARRELSKSITARYDAGTYSFKNLLSVYDYQVVPLNGRDETPNWSKAYTVHGGTDATVSGSAGNYLAIRSCPNEELHETVSQTRIISVATRQTLTITTWGNGSVTQPRSDGQYFTGDDVTLTAVPVAGAIFRGWFIGNEQVGRDTTYILEMTDYASITAKFEGGEEATAMKLDLVGADEVQAQSFLKRVWNFVTAQDVPETQVFAGSSAKLKITVEPANAAEQTVTWTTSKSDVATVDENGTIHFLKAGLVTITATLANGVTNSYPFTVLPNEVEKLTLTGEAKQTSYYECEDVSLDGLTVVATYSSGKTEEIEEGYTVEPTTLTTAGMQTITVTYEGQTVSFEVEVLHSGEWTVVKEATCAEPGSKEYHCLICGDLLETEEIPSPDHVCVWVVTQEATPDEPGTKSFVCQNCGETVQTQEIIWCDHTFEAEVTEPTCAEQGYTTYTCTKCGEVIVGSYTDALEHQYDAKIVEPSCGKVGYTVYTCSRCGDVSVADKVAALVHDYTEEEVKATCTKGGYTKHTCTICGSTYESDMTETIPHAYAAVPTEATCTEGGYTTYTCEMCGDVYIADETEPTGHTYTDTKVDGNCVEGGYALHTCTVCGHTEKEYFRATVEHVFGEWLVRKAADEDHAGEKFRVCTICGYEDTAPLPVIGHEHIAGEWYVEKEARCGEYGVRARKCTECEEIIETEMIAAPEHQFTKTVTAPTCLENGYTTHTCSICGFNYKDTIVPCAGQHTPGEWETKTAATCAEDGKRVKSCAVCGELLEEETVQATDHPNREWIRISEPTCDESGLREQKCKDCGETVDTEIIAPLGHQYSATVTEPTCTENGYTTFTCSECGHSYTAESTTATGRHTPGEWETAKEATCAEPGKKVRKCAVCGAIVEEDAIPVMDHTPGEWETLKEATYAEEGRSVRHCAVCGQLVDSKAIPRMPQPIIRIQNYAAAKTVDYRTTITFSADRVENPVFGAQIHWFVDGQDKGATDTCTVKEAKKDFTVQAKYVKDGKVLAESEIETVKANAGFFARLKAFFRALFKKLPVVVQEYLGVEILDRVLP